MSLLLLFQIGLIQSIKTANDTATIFLSSTESFSIDLDNLIEGQGLQYSLQQSLTNNGIELQGYFNATLTSKIKSENKAYSWQKFNQIVVFEEYFVAFCNQTVQYYQIQQNSLILTFNTTIQNIDYIYHIEKWQDQYGQASLFFLCSTNNSTQIFRASQLNGAQIISQVNIEDKLEEKILFNCLDKAFCVFSNGIGTKSCIYFADFDQSEIRIYNALCNYKCGSDIYPIDLIIAGNQEYYLLIADLDNHIVLYNGNISNLYYPSQILVQQYQSEVKRLTRIQAQDQWLIVIQTDLGLYLIDAQTKWNYFISLAKDSNINITPNYFISQSDRTILASYQLNTALTQAQISQSVDITLQIDEKEEILQILEDQNSSQLVLRTNQNLLTLQTLSKSFLLQFSQVKNSTTINLEYYSPLYIKDKVTQPIDIVVDDDMYKIKNRNGHYPAPFWYYDLTFYWISRNYSNQYYFNFYSQFTGWNMQFNCSSTLQEQNPVNGKLQMEWHYQLEQEIQIKRAKMLQDNQIWLMSDYQYFLLNIDQQYRRSYNITMQHDLISVISPESELYIMTGITTQNTTILYLVQGYRFPLISQHDTGIKCKKVQVNGFQILCTDYTVFQTYSFLQLIIVFEYQYEIKQDLGVIIDLLWSPRNELLVLTDKMNELIFLDYQLQKLSTLPIHNNTISIQFVDQNLVTVTEWGQVSFYDQDYTVMDWFQIQIDGKVKEVQYSSNSFLIKTLYTAYFIFLSDTQKRFLYYQQDIQAFQQIYLFEQTQLLTIDWKNQVQLFNLLYTNEQTSEIYFKFFTDPNSFLQGQKQSKVELIAQNQYDFLSIPWNMTLDYNDIFPYFNSTLFTNAQEIEVNYSQNNTIYLDEAVQGQNLYFDLDWQDSSNQDFYGVLSGYQLQLRPIQCDQPVISLDGPIWDKYIAVLCMQNQLNVYQFIQNNYELVKQWSLQEIDNEKMQANQFKILWSGVNYILCFCAVRMNQYAQGPQQALFFYLIKQTVSIEIEFMSLHYIKYGELQDIVKLDLQQPTFAAYFIPLQQTNSQQTLFTNFLIISLDNDLQIVKELLFDCSNLSTPITYYVYFYAETLNGKDIAYLIDMNMNLYVYEFTNGKMIYQYYANFFQTNWLWAYQIYKGWIYISTSSCIYGYEIKQDMQAPKVYCFQQNWDQVQVSIPTYLEINQNQSLMAMVMNKGTQYLYYQIFDMNAQKVVTMVNCQSKMQFDNGCIGKFVQDNVLANYSQNDFYIYFTQLQRPKIVIPQISYDQFSQLNSQKFKNSFYLMANNDQNYDGINSSLITIKRLGELKSSGSSLSVTVIIIISIVSFVVFLLFIILGYIWLKRRRIQNQSVPVRFEESINFQDFSHF